MLKVSAWGGGGLGSLSEKNGRTLPDPAEADGRPLPPSDAPSRDLHATGRDMDATLLIFPLPTRLHTVSTRP